MLKRFFVFTLLAGAAVAVIAGCDADPEQQRSVVSVTSFNCNAPAFADIRTDSSSYADTWAFTVFLNRPYDPLTVTASGLPYGDFQITSYQIEWTPLNGAPALPAPIRQEALSFSIGSGETVGVSIRLVNISEKSFIYNLNPSSVYDYLANITFVGHEVGTSRNTQVLTSATVEFANYSPDPEQVSCSF